MKVSALTKNGDWRFGRGQSDYIKRSAWVRQKVITRLRSHEQDWFLDMNHGVPWFNSVGQRGTKEQLSAEIEEVILNTDGVLAIDSLSVALTDRGYTAQITIRDVFEETQEIEI